MGQHFPNIYLKSYIKWLTLAIVLLGTLFSIALSSYAQVEPIDRASVSIDGRTLFEVAATEPFNADQRADSINHELKERVTTEEDLLVATDIDNRVPIIFVNGRYLMTVTQADANLNGAADPQEQAFIWTSLLNRELAIAQQERSQEVQSRRALIAVGLLILATIVHQLLGYLWRNSVRPMLEHRGNQHEREEKVPVGSNLLLSLLLLMLRSLLWFGTAIYITNLFPFTRRWSYFLRKQALVSLLEPNLRIGQNSFSVLNLFILSGLLLGVVILSGTLSNFLRSRVLRLTGMARGSREAISILVRYGLIFIGAVVLLQIWGLDLSSLALIASALGLGIGLGLQNIVKDFGSGLVLVFERPIQVGDFLEFHDFQGTVERIGARSTEIKTLDQVSIIVPNSRFLEQEVINWSHRNPVSRIRIPVGVSYSSNPQVVRDVLIETSHQHMQILSTPSPQVFFIGFGDSSLNFELLVWIANPAQQLIIKSDLYFAIEATLREHKIEIPFPQRDLHLRTGQLPIELSSSTSKHFEAYGMTLPKSSIEPNSK
ncbi:MAG: mechanosensitive ion channel domain-containing protein [Cyanobacteria bacterium P01_H01_bin.58]